MASHSQEDRPLDPEIQDMLDTWDEWTNYPYIQRGYLFEIPGSMEVLPRLPNDIPVLYIGPVSEKDRSLKRIEQLPDDLEELYCARLETLEYIAYFPPKLKRIYLNENALRTLPPLPEGLVELHCYQNPLESLPTLPNSLEELWCERDAIKELPNVPPNLKVLVGCGEVRGPYFEPSGDPYEWSYRGPADEDSYTGNCINGY
jgi:hypothetical protein